MKTVMAFGTFDNLHAGHLSYLEQARKSGDRLIVIVARDINVEKIKGKLPKQSEKNRLINIKKVEYIDRAVLGRRKDRMNVIKKFKPDIIFLGYDQEVNISELKKVFKGRILRGRPHKEKVYKSSRLVG